MPQNFLKGSKHALIPGTPRRGAWHGADTPANSSEIRFCDPKHRIWSNISATGGGPRVDGFAFATDDIGLGVLLRKGTVFQMFQDQREAVNVGEYGASRAILEAGYGLDCLCEQFQGRDWRDPARWPGPDGVAGFASVGQMLAQGRIGTAARSIYAIQPMETIFVRTWWADGSAPRLEQVDEGLAHAVSLVTESAYTAFLDAAADPPDGTE